MLKPKYRTLGEAYKDFRGTLEALDVRMPKDHIPLSEEQEDALVEEVLSDAWKPAAPHEMYARTQKLQSIAQKRSQALSNYQEKHPNVRVDKPLHWLAKRTQGGVSGAHKDHQHNLYTMHAKAAAAYSALARHAGEADKHHSVQGDDQSSDAYHDMASRAHEKAQHHSSMVAGHSQHMAKVGDLSRKWAGRLAQTGTKVPTFTGRSKKLYPQPAQKPAAQPAPAPKKARNESLDEFRVLAGLTERQLMPRDPGMSGTTKWNDKILEEASEKALPLVEMGPLVGGIGRGVAGPVKRPPGIVVGPKPTPTKPREQAPVEQPEVRAKSSHNSRRPA